MQDSDTNPDSSSSWAFFIEPYCDLFPQKRKDLEDKDDPKPGKKAKIAGAVPESPSNVSLNALLPLSVAASGERC